MKPGPLESQTLAMPRTEDPASWLARARVRGDAGDGPGEIEALERAIGLASDPVFLNARTLLVAARRLTRLQASAAASAWRAFLALDPDHVEGRNRLAEAELYDLPGAARRTGPKLAVVGNCQAYGLAMCLRRLWPEAEVRALSVGELGGPEEAAAMAERFSQVDAVIGQPLGAKHGPLSSSSLATAARRFILFPRIHFDGFQPDMQAAGAYPRGMHSKLALAGYAMGLAEARVADLFNAYVYGVLGYFEAHAKADHHLREAAKAAGLDVEPLLEDWRASGVYMHAPVHPTIAVSWSIARGVARALGRDVGPADADIADPLEPLGAWPVYPEIAARLGVAGGLTFKFKGEPAMDLEAMIARRFRDYAALDQAKLFEGVAAVIQTLKGEGI